MHIQTYSGIFGTLYNPRMFTYLEPEAYLKPCETLTRHVQNPSHRALFNHIQAHSKPYTTLANEETRHTRNPRIFRTLP